MSLIVIYASTGGNTKAVAEYIATKTGGKAVPVSDAGSEDLQTYDTIVIGGRVWAGSLPKELVQYVNKNKDIISGKNAAFFDCCMYNDEKGQSQSDKLASELGIANHTFFNKGKKLVQSNPGPIDAFIATFQN
jgi:menaquinone-dependent protoporphyrinogen oxidase